MYLRAFLVAVNRSYDSRKYAKKQITFMKGIPGAQKVSADDVETVQNLIDAFFVQHPVLAES